MDLDYDDCPATCAEGEQTKPNSFCDDCPVKTAKDGFRDFCEASLDRACPNKWRKYGFENLNRSVEEISGLQDLPRGERSFITHRLIQEFCAARNRFEKIQRENEKPAE